MSNLSTTVEILAGTSIEQAIIEAKGLAQRMDLAFVKFNFNGVQVSVSQNADVYNLAQDYRYELDDAKEHRSVVG